MGQSSTQISDLIAMICACCTSYGLPVWESIFTTGSPFTSYLLHALAIDYQYGRASVTIRHAATGGHIANTRSIKALFH